MLADPAHRTWPLPDRPFAMHMRWHDLLFAHWPVPATFLRPLLPAGLELDCFNGQAYLGIVPFYMTGIRPRCCPPLPGLSQFAEINLRTYAIHDGKPGVWFFSLDAESAIAVRMARWRFHLPYFDARMAATTRDGWVHYESRRIHRGAPPALFNARYRPTSDAAPTQPGSLEHWLTARYTLFSADRHGTLYRGDIDHAPWPLQTAEAEFTHCDMTTQIGLSPPNTPPLLHFSKQLDVTGWTLDRLT